MKDSQLTKIEEICEMLKNIPFWTDMIQPPTPDDYKPTGVIMVWIKGLPWMADQKSFQVLMEDTANPPECWCRIVPPRPRIKNDKH